MVWIHTGYLQIYSDRGQILMNPIKFESTIQSEWLYDPI